MKNNKKRKNLSVIKSANEWIKDSNTIISQLHAMEKEMKKLYLTHDQISQPSFSKDILDIGQTFADLMNNIEEMFKSSGMDIIGVNSPSLLMDMNLRVQQRDFIRNLMKLIIVCRILITEWDAPDFKEYSMTLFKESKSSFKKMIRTRKELQLQLKSFESSRVGSSTSSINNLKIQHSDSTISMSQSLTRSSSTESMLAEKYSIPILTFSNSNTQIRDKNQSNSYPVISENSDNKNVKTKISHSSISSTSIVIDDDKINKMMAETDKLFTSPLALLESETDKDDEGGVKLQTINVMSFDTSEESSEVSDSDQKKSEEKEDKASNSIIEVDIAEIKNPGSEKSSILSDIDPSDKEKRSDSPKGVKDEIDDKENEKNVTSQLNKQANSNTNSSNTSIYNKSESKEKEIIPVSPYNTILDSTSKELDFENNVLPLTSKTSMLHDNNVESDLTEMSTLPEKAQGFKNPEEFRLLESSTSQETQAKDGTNIISLDAGKMNENFTKDINNIANTEIMPEEILDSKSFGSKEEKEEELEELEAKLDESKELDVEGKNVNLNEALDFKNSKELIPEKSDILHFDSEVSKESSDEFLDENEEKNSDSSDGFTKSIRSADSFSSNEGKSPSSGESEITDSDVASSSHISELSKGSSFLTVTDSDEESLELKSKISQKSFWSSSGSGSGSGSGSSIDVERNNKDGMSSNDQTTDQSSEDYAESEVSYSSASTVTTTTSRTTSFRYSPEGSVHKVISQTSMHSHYTHSYRSKVSTKSSKASIRSGSISIKSTTTKSDKRSIISSEKLAMETIEEGKSDEATDKGKLFKSLDNSLNESCIDEDNTSEMISEGKSSSLKYDIAASLTSNVNSKEIETKSISSKVSYSSQEKDKGKDKAGSIKTDSKRSSLINRALNKIGLGTVQRKGSVKSAALDFKEDGNSIKDESKIEEYDNIKSKLELNPNGNQSSIDVMIEGRSKEGSISDILSTGEGSINKESTVESTEMTSLECSSVAERSSSAKSSIASTKDSATEESQRDDGQVEGNLHDESTSRINNQRISFSQISTLDDFRKATMLQHSEVNRSSVISTSTIKQRGRTSTISNKTIRPEMIKSEDEDSLRNSTSEKIKSSTETSDARSKDSEANSEEDYFKDEKSLSESKDSFSQITNDNKDEPEKKILSREGSVNSCKTHKSSGIFLVRREKVVINVSDDDDEMDIKMNKQGKWNIKFNEEKSMCPTKVELRDVGICRKVLANLIDSYSAEPVDILEELFQLVLGSTIEPELFNNILEKANKSLSSLFAILDSLGIRDYKEDFECNDFNIRFDLLREFILRKDTIYNDLEEILTIAEKRVYLENNEIKQDLQILFISIIKEYEELLLVSKCLLNDVGFLNLFASLIDDFERLENTIAKSADQKRLKELIRDLGSINELRREQEEQMNNPELAKKKLRQSLYAFEKWAKKTRGTDDGFEDNVDNAMEKTLSELSIENQDTSSNSNSSLSNESSIETETNISLFEVYSESNSISRQSSIAQLIESTKPESTIANMEKPAKDFKIRQNTGLEDIELARSRMVLNNISHLPGLNTLVNAYLKEGYKSRRSISNPSLTNDILNDIDIKSFPVLEILPEGEPLSINSIKMQVSSKYKQSDEKHMGFALLPQRSNSKISSSDNESLLNEALSDLNRYPNPYISSVKTENNMFSQPDKNADILEVSVNQIEQLKDDSLQDVVEIQKLQDISSEESYGSENGHAADFMISSKETSDDLEECLLLGENSQYENSSKLKEYKPISQNQSMELDNSIPDRNYDNEANIALANQPKHNLINAEDNIEPNSADEEESFDDDNEISNLSSDKELKYYEINNVKEEVHIQELSGQSSLARSTLTSLDHTDAGVLSYENSDSLYLNNSKNKSEINSTFDIKEENMEDISNKHSDSKSSSLTASEDEAIPSLDINSCKYDSPSDESCYRLEHDKLIEKNGYLKPTSEIKYKPNKFQGIVLSVRASTHFSELSEGTQEFYETYKTSNSETKSKNVQEIVMPSIDYSTRKPVRKYSRAPSICIWSAPNGNNDSGLISYQLECERNTNEEKQSPGLYEASGTDHKISTLHVVTESPLSYTGSIESPIDQNDPNEDKFSSNEDSQFPSRLNNTVEDDLTSLSTNIQSNLKLKGNEEDRFEQFEISDESFSSNEGDILNNGSQNSILKEDKTHSDEMTGSSINKILPDSNMDEGVNIDEDSFDENEGCSTSSSSSLDRNSPEEAGTENVEPDLLGPEPNSATLANMGEEINVGGNILDSETSVTEPLNKMELDTTSENNPIMLLEGFDDINEYQLMKKASEQSRSIELGNIVSNTYSSVIDDNSAVNEEFEDSTQPTLPINYSETLERSASVDIESFNPLDKALEMVLTESPVKATPLEQTLGAPLDEMTMCIFSNVDNDSILDENNTINSKELNTKDLISIKQENLDYIENQIDTYIEAVFSKEQSSSVTESNLIKSQDMVLKNIEQMVDSPNSLTGDSSTESSDSSASFFMNKVDSFDSEFESDFGIDKKHIKEQIAEEDKYVEAHKNKSLIKRFNELASIPGVNTEQSTKIGLINDQVSDNNEWPLSETYVLDNYSKQNHDKEGSIYSVRSYIHENTDPLKIVDVYEKGANFDYLEKEDSLSPSLNKEDRAESDSNLTSTDSGIESSPELKGFSSMGNEKDDMMKSSQRNSLTNISFDAESDIENSASESISKSNMILKSISTATSFTTMTSTTNEDLTSNSLSKSDSPILINSENEFRINPKRISVTMINDFDENFDDESFKFHLPGPPTESPSLSYKGSPNELKDEVEDIGEESSAAESSVTDKLKDQSSFSESSDLCSSSNESSIRKEELSTDEDEGLGIEDMEIVIEPGETNEIVVKEDIEANFIEDKSKSEKSSIKSFKSKKEVDSDITHSAEEQDNDLEEVHRNDAPKPVVQKLAAADGSDEEIASAAHTQLANEDEMNDINSKAGSSKQLDARKSIDVINSKDSINDERRPSVNTINSGVPKFKTIAVIAGLFSLGKGRKIGLTYVAPHGAEFIAGEPIPPNPHYINRPVQTQGSKKPGIRRGSNASNLSGRSNSPFPGQSQTTSRGTSPSASRKSSIDANAGMIQGSRKNSVTSETGNQSEIVPLKKETAGSQLNPNNRRRRGSESAVIGDANSKAAELATKKAQRRMSLQVDLTKDVSQENLESKRSSRRASLISNNPLSSYSFLGYDYTEDDIRYKDGMIIYATLKALVEKLTLHDSSIDSKFIETFLLTFRAFCKASALVDHLIARYLIEPPQGLTEEEVEIWRTHKQTSIRIRVNNFIKTWLESYFYIKDDGPCLEKLIGFAKGPIMDCMPSAGTRILKNCESLLEKYKEVNEDQKLANSKTMELLKASAMAKLPNIPPPLPIIAKGIAKSLLTGLPFRIIDLDPMEVARQLTIMDCKAFCGILPHELIGLEFSKKSPSVKYVKMMTDTTNEITALICDCILKEPDIKKRCNLVKYFIKVGENLLILKNYNSLIPIVGALNSSMIARLKRTWALLPPKFGETFEQLRKATDHSRNYADYRNVLKTSMPPCMPFLGLYLTDLTFTDEGNNAFLSEGEGKPKLVNFAKYARTVAIVQEIQKFQVPYNLIEVKELQERIKGWLKQANQMWDEDKYYNNSLILEPRVSKQSTSAPPKVSLKDLNYEEVSDLTKVAYF